MKQKNHQGKQSTSDVASKQVEDNENAGSQDVVGGDIVVNGVDTGLNLGEGDGDGTGDPGLNARDKDEMGVKAEDGQPQAKEVVDGMNDALNESKPEAQDGAYLTPDSELSEEENKRREDPAMAGALAQQKENANSSTDDQGKQQEAPAGQEGQDNKEEDSTDWRKQVRDAVDQVYSRVGEEAGKAQETGNDYGRSAEYPEFTPEAPRPSGVQAKFRADSVEPHIHEGETLNVAVSLSAVTTGSEENKSFWKNTPAGNLQLTITNPEGYKAFETGKEYFVTITPAE